MADNKIYRNPELKSGYTGDEEPSRLQEGPPIRTEGLAAEENRGRKAPREGSGAVVGSGAGAGGGGGEEDFDSDPQAGGGNIDTKRDGPRPGRGGDAPSHGSR